MDLHAKALHNEGALNKNSYPGRGIIIGLTPNGRDLVQVYWIMGRSENSRNRVFVNEENVVKTRPFDPSKVKDPSLIIYNVMLAHQTTHIVTNGDQTDTICAGLQKGADFAGSLLTRTYEPDEPNFTPRISGLAQANNPQFQYQLSILKAPHNNPLEACREFFSYEKGIPGLGHCIHTYAADGNPLPPFEGEPYLVRIFDSIDENAGHYWGILNGENRISLVVKHIALSDGTVSFKIINKYQ